MYIYDDGFNFFLNLLLVKLTYYDFTRIRSLLPPLLYPVCNVFLNSFWGFCLFLVCFYF